MQNMNVFVWNMRKKQMQQKHTKMRVTSAKMMLLQTVLPFVCCKMSRFKPVLLNYMKKWLPKRLQARLKFKNG